MPIYDEVSGTFCTDGFRRVLAGLGTSQSLPAASGIEIGHVTFSSWFSAIHR